MANRIVKGFWDCPQCGMKGIDGLVDTCPGCGSGKDKSVRYYIKTVEEVSDDELASAGISKDENDGSHKEWVCAYCGFLNNYADTVCVRCGAGKDEKETEYEGNTSETLNLLAKEMLISKTICSTLCLVLMMWTADTRK